ncbi:geranyltranstransferase IspA [Octadecabacter antarcticus 307]|uniref:Geranylgeranyl diphosphate synthase n=1 Tax=Octadecabacter antarcticus 307 TaxID=391626 RepID=M9RJD4_9RHOB|nr:polyprenyl synthetase family protein [Octadecabacter antarcticus]AGI69930.1 geranyltranstransferase IspA [Octadecabacter antarcticus 307]
MADALKDALKHAAQIVETTIEAAVRPVETVVPDAMMYAVRGGKALRGFLVLEGARLHGVEERIAAPIAGAIEAMHAYSLIHDDLPCMDDDDVRRGKPTVHRKWDAATAVLTGDALQALAFELIMSADIKPEAKVVLAHMLAIDAGERGMVGGQAADIAAETADAPLTLREIESLQAKKTGALIEWACAAGPRIAGADEMPMRHYGQALGRAFQIADDILDVTGDANTVGKAVCKDDAAGKATFVSLLGLDGAKRRAVELVDEACDALDVYKEAADTLKAAARFVVNRSR